MDNLRRVNSVLGATIKEINTNVSDDEIDSSMGITVGDFIDTLATAPECVRKMTFDNLVTFILKSLDNTEKTDEDFEEMLSLFFDHNPTEEEMQEVIDGLEVFSKAFGW